MEDWFSNWCYKVRSFWKSILGDLLFLIKSLKTVCWIWLLLAGSGSVFGSASSDSGNIMFWRIPDEIWRDLDSYILKIHQVVKKIVMRSILALIFKILANVSMLLLSLKMEAAKNLDFLTKCPTLIAFNFGTSGSILEL